MDTFTEFRLPVWHWKDAQTQRRSDWPDAAPAEPSLGQGWFDADTDSLLVWNGVDWVSAPQD